MKNLQFRDWCDDSREKGIRKVTYCYQFINDNGKVLCEGSIPLPDDTEKFWSMNNKDLEIFMSKIRKQFFDKLAK